MLKCSSCTARLKLLDTLGHGVAQRTEEPAPTMRTRLHVDIYVVIYGRELARRNAQAVPAHLTVYGMRQRERVAQQLVLFRGQRKNFATACH